MIDGRDVHALAAGKQGGLRRAIRITKNFREWKLKPNKVNVIDLGEPYEHTPILDPVLQPKNVSGTLG